MITIEDVILSPPGIGETLDLKQIFGARAIEMEIGAGKGGFLLRRAQALPDRGFLGVEWANKYCRYAADRMARWGITNVRMMRTDARHLVMHQMVPRQVSILHVYHPDPWPKKRHHKRRLIQPSFIDMAWRLLVPGGRIAIQTDHAGYFEQIQEVLLAEDRFVQVPFDVPEAGTIDGRVQTNFEVKYLREGRSIYQIAAERPADAED